MEDGNGPLFETERRKGRKLYKVFAATVVVSIMWIWIYRATRLPALTAVSGSWGGVGMFVSEVWLGLYWMVTQSVRWNPTYRRTFKHRLSQR